ncbi:MAG: hypothetical protein MZV65_38965 [Chromatiales bacterium]|nr:hypothetical protein [Chromatiales bacterium]
MRDFILTFPTEPTAIATLPAFRGESEEGETWTGAIIPNCTRWIERPVYDAETEETTPGTAVPGWHCIIRTHSVPSTAQPYLVTEATDIEPIPAGGLLKPTVPQVVSRFQARAAMHIHGVLEAVEAEIQAADPIAQMAWADAQQFERPSPTIAAIAQKLGWTDEFVDTLFITAGGIKA